MENQNRKRLTGLLHKLVDAARNGNPGQQLDTIFNDILIESNNALQIGDFDKLAEISLFISERSYGPITMPLYTKKLTEEYNELLQVLPKEGETANFTRVNDELADMTLVLVKLANYFGLTLYHLLNHATHKMFMRLSNPDYGREKTENLKNAIHSVSDGIGPGLTHNICEIINLKQINTDIADGRLLMAAVARITTMIDTDKTPDDVIKLLNNIASDMYNNTNLYRSPEGQLETTQQTVDRINNLKGDQSRVPLEQLKQLKSVTWDGDLIHKASRDELLKDGFCTKFHGWNLITPAGVQKLNEYGILSTNREKNDQPEQSAEQQYRDGLRPENIKKPQQPKLNPESLELLKQLINVTRSNDISDERALRDLETRGLVKSCLGWYVITFIGIRELIGLNLLPAPHEEMQSFALAAKIRKQKVIIVPEKIEPEGNYYNEATVRKIFKKFFKTYYADQTNPVQKDFEHWFKPQKFDNVIHLNLSDFEEIEQKAKDHNYESRATIHETTKNIEKIIDAMQEIRDMGDIPLHPVGVLLKESIIYISNVLEREAVHRQIIEKLCTNATDRLRGKQNIYSSAAPAEKSKNTIQLVKPDGKGGFLLVGKDKTLTDTDVQLLRMIEKAGFVGLDISKKEKIIGNYLVSLGLVEIHAEKYIINVAGVCILGDIDSQTSATRKITSPHQINMASPEGKLLFVCVYKLKTSHYKGYSDEEILSMLNQIAAV